MLDDMRMPAILFLGELKQGNVGDKYNTIFLVTSFQCRSPFLPCDSD